VTLPTMCETLPRPASDRDPIDFLSEHGAHVLKKTIEAYWEARGYMVRLKISTDMTLRIGAPGMSRANMCVVRGDMVGGLPREAWQRARDANAERDRENAA
jgi:hypothetical protein